MEDKTGRISTGISGLDTALDALRRSGSVALIGLYDEAVACVVGVCVIFPTDAMIAVVGIAT